MQVRDMDVQSCGTQTKIAWSNVEVWVNDHFRGVAPALQAGRQAVVPLDSLAGCLRAAV